MCSAFAWKDSTISSQQSMHSRAATFTPAEAGQHRAHSPNGRVFVDIVDEVMRLNGRLIAATKLNTQVAGLRPPHWILLSAVVCAPEPPTVPRIGRALGQSRQSIQRTADHLVAEGFIEWILNPDHARAKRLVATDKGMRTYAQADRESAAWADRIVSGIDIAELEAGVALLRTVRRRLEDDARR